MVQIGDADLIQRTLTLELSEDDRWPGWVFTLLMNRDCRVVKFGMHNEVDSDAEVTASLLRTVKVDELRRVARPWWARTWQELAGGFAGIQASPALAEELRRTTEAGGVQRLREHAEVAQDYLAECDSGESGAAARVAAARWVSTRAIQKRLKTAEQLGVFVPAGGNRPGGHLTELGMHVLSEGNSER